MQTSYTQNGTLALYISNKEMQEGNLRIGQPVWVAVIEQGIILRTIEPSAKSIPDPQSYKRLSIGKPTSGHWARIQAGQYAKRPESKFLGDEWRCTNSNWEMIVEDDDFVGFLIKFPTVKESPVVISPHHKTPVPRKITREDMPMSAIETPEVQEVQPEAQKAQKLTAFVLLNLPDDTLMEAEIPLNVAWRLNGILIKEFGIQLAISEKEISEK